MGGSAQNTSSINSSIDFSPIIQFGEDQTSTQDKINKQEAALSPEQDAGFGASLGIGVGGGSGSASLSQPSSSYESGKTTSFSDTPGIQKSGLEALGITPTQALIGISVVAAAYLFKKKK